MTLSTFASPGVSLQGSNETASLPISGNGATVTASTPLVDGTQTWNNAAVTFNAFKIDVTDTTSAAGSLLMDLQVGAATKFRIDKSGNVGLYASSALRLGGSSVNWQLTLATTGIIQGSANYYGFYDGTNLAAGGSVDTLLTRRAAANLRFGNADAAAPVAQTLSVQSVVAGTTNTAGANLTITGSQSTGNASGGSIIFQVAAAGSSGSAQNALATALTIGSTGNVTTSAAVVVGGDIYLSGLSNAALRGVGSGIALIANTSFNDFNRLQFGGTTSSFPALKRSSTTLQARLADDSAFASVQGKLTTDTAYTVGAIVVTGYLTLYDSTGTAYRVPCVV